VPNSAHNTTPDLQEVTTRNDTARQIIAGFATTLPTLADYWRTIDTALTDIADLAASLISATSCTPKRRGGQDDEGPSDATPSPQDEPPRRTADDAHHL
jgi:hypothetical protein